MSGPSCVNSRDWSFLVTRDPDILRKMADANGRPADPLRETFSLPETVVPHSIIAFGYPDEQTEAKGFFEESRVHIDKW